MATTAFVVDIGVVYAERIQLSNALDAAGLAAALELPNDTANARVIAEEYLLANDVDPADVVIDIALDGMSIELVGTKVVSHYFAQIIGIGSSEVNVNSRVQLGSLKAVSNGVRPFAVEKYDFTFGDIVTLKVGGGEGYHGNYGAIALGGSGASVFRDNALFGYSGTIAVGDIIPTEPGNMAGATSAIRNYINSIPETFDDFDRGSDRVWIIPLVDSLGVDGREDIEVVGFGQFFVEAAASHAGKIEVTGRFVQYVTNGDLDLEIEDTGAYAVKLVE